MRTVLYLALLGIGFFGGIYVGVHYPQQAANIDQVRAQEQAKLKPQLDAAAAKAKIELLTRLLRGQSAAPAGSAGFVAANSPDNRRSLQDELQQEQQKLSQAQSQLDRQK